MAEFLAMGGYGGYVWSAFGLATVAMAGLAVLSRRADRKALDMIRRQRGGNN